MSFFERFFLNIPLPFSVWVYELSKLFLFKDIRTPGFDQAVQIVKSKGVKGDYLEFGVYKGNSLIKFYKLFQKYGLEDIRIFAFDAFKGLPVSEGGVFNKGEFHYPKDLFLRRMKKAGVDFKKILIVEGFFNTSLTEDVKKKHALSKAAVIHVDCDLYESTVDVLRFCENLVQEGTVLILDDYLSFQTVDIPENYGEEKAFKEWSLYPRFEELYEIGVSKAFVCKTLK